MDNDNQAYLDQIERNIRSKDDEKDSARQEAEQRAAEMDRIRKASAEHTGGVPRGKGGAAAPKAAVRKPSELENDPRYREYFERLKKQKSTSTPPAGIGPAGPAGGAPSTGAAVPKGAAAPVRQDSQTIAPGSIVRFDDGSIGIYKDAVSGRDYALFYFLQPDGQFSPEGVFLQCYQAKAIGTLPDNYFAQMRDEDQWNRDLILYHLSSFEHVGFLNNLAEHVERKPKSNNTPPKNATQSQINQAQPEPQPEAQSKSPEKATPTASTKDESSQDKTDKQDHGQDARATPSAPKKDGGLERGRKFEINFNGKRWEAVYWTSDSDGMIVAHSTHGNWSLMRLDLDRFKDSLKLGDIVDSDTMDAIAKEAANK